MPVTYSSRYFNFHKDMNMFSTDMSMLPTPLGESGSFYIQSVKTGVKKLFLFQGADKDGSNEDTYGWRFICPGGGYTALIVNT